MITLQNPLPPQDVEIESMFRKQMVSLDSLERTLNKMTHETKKLFSLLIAQFWTEI